MRTCFDIIIPAYAEIEKNDARCEVKYSFLKDKKVRSTDRAFLYP